MYEAIQRTAVQSQSVLSRFGDGKTVEPGMQVLLFSREGFVAFPNYGGLV